MLRPSHVRAVVGAVALVLAFLLTQVVVGGLAYVLARAAGWELSFDELGAADALALAGIEAMLLLVGVALGPQVGTCRQLGVRPSPAEQRGSWRAIAPAGLVIVLPGVLFFASAGEPLVARSIGLAEAGSFTLLAVLIAVTEEFWYRGLVFEQLGSSGSVRLAVFGSALLFGLPHISPEPASWLNAAGVTLAVGIPFACVRARYPALAPLVAWHAAIDTWAFLHTAEIQVSGSPSAAEVASGLIVPGLLALGYVAWLQRSLREAAPLDR